jgi:hypothetical protein
MDAGTQGTGDAALPESPGKRSVINLEIYQSRTTRYWDFEGTDRTEGARWYQESMPGIAPRSHRVYGGTHEDISAPRDVEGDAPVRATMFGCLGHRR